MIPAPRLSTVDTGNPLKEHPMLDPDVRRVLDGASFAHLATVLPDGAPHNVPVYVGTHGDRIVFMTGPGTRKARNLRRDPRAALEVTSPDGWAWATAEGTVTLTGPGTDPHGPEVEALVDYYRRAAGEHPDWAEYRAAMTRQGKSLLRITVERWGPVATGGFPPEVIDKL